MAGWKADKRAELDVSQAGRQAGRLEGPLSLSLSLSKQVDITTQHIRKAQQIFSVSIKRAFSRGFFRAGRDGEFCSLFWLLLLRAYEETNATASVLIDIDRHTA